MCTHPMIQGDNYGTTCMVCGEVLEGYGFWAEGSNSCHHKWIPEPDSKYEVCMYCEMTRPKGDNGES